MWRLWDGSIGEIIAYPPAVEPMQNEWYERDGVETSEEPLQEAEKLVSIGLIGTEPMVQFVKSLLEEGGYKGRISGVPWEVQLKPKDIEWAYLKKHWTTLTMQDLGDRFPREPIMAVYAGNRGSRIELIEGEPFTQFGVKVLEEIRSREPVRETLRGAKGLTIGGYKTQITMVMRADTVPNFVTNRNALLYMLTYKSKIELEIGDEVFWCYYNRCHTNWFVNNGSLSWHFTLTLTVI